MPFGRLTLGLGLGNGRLAPVGGGDGGGGGSGVSFAKTDTYVSSFSSGATIVSDSLSFGAYAADRKTYIAICWVRGSSNLQLSSVSVGGASATRVLRTSTVNVASDAEIWVLDSGVGSSLEDLENAAITLTFNGSVVVAGIIVFRGIGYATTASDTQFGTNTVAADIPAGGIAIVANVGRSTASGSLSNVTEDLSAALSASVGYALVGSKVSEAGESLTVHYTGSTTLPAMSLATFAAA